MKKLSFGCLSLFVLFSSCLQEKKVNWYQYKEITNIKELMNFYPGLVLDTTDQSESAIITEYADLSCTLEYTYDNLEDSTKNQLYYSIDIETNISESEAKKSFMVMKATYDGASSIVGLTNEEVEMELPGDENYYVIRMLDKEPNGVIYLTRRGKVVYSLIISGFYTSDHSLINDLILPDIENLKDFKIKKRFYDEW